MADEEPNTKVPLMATDDDDLYHYQPQHGFPWVRVSVAVARTTDLQLPPAGCKVCDDTTAERMKWAFTVFVGLCSLFTSGGLLYGWGPLQNRLRRELGFHEVMCPGPHDYCGGIQQAFLQYTYCAAVLFGMTGGMIFASILLDLIGPRWTSVFGLLVSIGGNLTLAFTQWEVYWMFLPAITLIAFGGMCPFLAAHYVVNFWREKHVILCAVVTCFDSSGFVYMLLQYVRWVSRTQWFCFFAFLCVLFIIGCVILLPDVPSQIGEQCVLPALMKIPYFWPIAGNANHPPAVAEEAPAADEPPSGEQPPEGAGRSVPIAPILTEREMHTTLDECIYSSNYQWVVLHFAVCHFLTMWLGGALPDLLSQVGDPDYFTHTLYPLVCNATFLFTPFVAQTLEEKGFGAVLAYSIASLQATMLLCIVPRLWPQMLTLTAFSIAKSFVYTGFFSYIALNFPVQHYGALVSIALSRAMLMGLLAFPLIYFQQHVFHGDYVLLLLGMIVLCLPLYKFPVMLYHQTMQQMVDRSIPST